MALAESDTSLCILLRARGSVCALSLQHLSEVMRPLAIEPVAGVPDFVLGLSVIRGKPTPVVSLAALFEAGSPEALTRLVALRTERGPLALGVTEVLGIGDLSGTAAESLPPLVSGLRAEAVEAIAARHERLLFVLQAGRLLPEDAWRTLNSRDERP